MSGLEEFSPEERKLRIELAAAYRLSALNGWDDLIYNHISVRIPGPQHEFLINPFGLRYDEVTASSLVKIDLEGNVLHPGSSNGRINKAGFVIHSTIHAQREDAQCVLHNHNNEIVAVSAMKCGFLPLSQNAMYLGKITYHDYEGLVLQDSERETITRDFALDSKVLMLRNHGAITIGKTVAEAYIAMNFLTKACAIQVMAMSGATDTSHLILPSEQVQKLTFKETQSFNQEGVGELEFQALLRKLDKIDPSDKQ